MRPSEHEYYFDELDEIVEMFSHENHDIIFATPTAALPA
ncbi:MULTISPECIES: beta-galactosidase [Tissierellales]